MHSDILGIEIDRGLDRSLKIVETLTGKHRNEIHINVKVPCNTHESIRLEDILYRMSATDEIESILLKGLWIDRYAGNASITHHGEFLGCQRLGAPCLHRKLLAFGVDRRENGVQLFWSSWNIRQRHNCRY